MFERVLLTLALSAVCCGTRPSGGEGNGAPKNQKPLLLLVTMDTTRADMMGFENGAVKTPHLDALAAGGTVFTQAYTTAPMTLPAHASMMTGLLPGDHRIHENARFVDSGLPLLSEGLQAKGYQTAAFIGGFPLSRQFGLARGFDHYDDDFEDGQNERNAELITGRAITFMNRHSEDPLFLWVHYFDPHEPYAAPEPFGSQYPENPYGAEIAFMDHHLGRLIAAFEDRAQGLPFNILVLADHGEGLGEHGELYHGNLLYQGTMRVPMIAAGHGVGVESVATPVSICGVYSTILGWAERQASPGLFGKEPEVVLGEAMKPYLQYGWQPQVMAVGEGLKVIQSGGELEIYQPVLDPRETQNLAGQREVPEVLAARLESYPVPVQGAAGNLSQEDAERMASLGYASFGSVTQLREDAPAPRSMAHLFADLDLGSGLFVRQKYEQSLSVFQRVLDQDPNNLMVVVRLAVIHSLLGREAEALDYFRQASRIDPKSKDLEHFAAMHYVRFQKWDRAEPLLESVLEHMPNKLPALEALALIRYRQGRRSEAIALLQKVVQLKKQPSAALNRLAQLHMQQGESQAAADAFERSRQYQGSQFNHYLELGVCYLDLRQFAAAREALDLVAEDHPQYPMALFKRAQVSVLLQEPEWQFHLRKARERSNSVTSELIKNEKLFQSATP